MKTGKILLKSIFFFALAITLNSCNKGPVFEQYYKPKNAAWDRFNIVPFEIPVKEAGQNYDITVIVRCTEKFTYDNLPFYVILTTPSGEERMREITVPVKEKGKLVMDPKATKPESRMILWKSIQMAETGKCKITLENMIPYIQTEGIEELGILVTKSK